MRRHTKMLIISIISVLTISFGVQSNIADVHASPTLQNFTIVLKYMYEK